jgi:hypothetical protein
MIWKHVGQIKLSTTDKAALGAVQSCSRHLVNDQEGPGGVARSNQGGKDIRDACYVMAPRGRTLSLVNSSRLCSTMAGKNRWIQWVCNLVCAFATVMLCWINLRLCMIQLRSCGTATSKCSLMVSRNME